MCFTGNRKTHGCPSPAVLKAQRRCKGPLKRVAVDRIQLFSEWSEAAFAQ
jgi:hypothetical protein